MNARYAKSLFAQVRTLLEQKRLLQKSGKIVDATIIEASPSTKSPSRRVNAIARLHNALTVTD
jgi:hypothetical protein